MAKRIMIGGAIAHHPLGGAGTAWAFLQYVLGFRALGYETYYVEHLDRKHCIDDDWQPAPFATSANARHFAAVIDSAVEGIEKPDPRLFRLALERVAADADTTLHVGDMYHVDVVGARAAGLRVVLLDSDGLYPDADCPRVASLLALADHLCPAGGAP